MRIVTIIYPNARPDIQLQISVKVENIDSSLDALERCFALLNNGSPEGQIPAEIGCRSLSVGDVGIVDSKEYYICAPVGWQRVTEQQATVQSKLSFTAASRAAYRLG